VGKLGQVGGSSEAGVSTSELLKAEGKPGPTCHDDAALLGPLTELRR
jgi:hypothetical protein